MLVLGGESGAREDGSGIELDTAVAFHDGESSLDTSQFSAGLVVENLCSEVANMEYKNSNSKLGEGKHIHVGVANTDPCDCTEPD